jgi:hypothetical protein
MLMVGILCFTTPLAVAYGFHAWRHAAQRDLAWVGLTLSLLVFIPFVLVMIGSVLNVGVAICR